jgi:hypothetical protein
MIRVVFCQGQAWVWVVFFQIFFSQRLVAPSTSPTLDIGRQCIG